MAKVALLAEGVDRNFATGKLEPPVMRSPSSRRAWIEIRFGDRSIFLHRVALLAEGVDRNLGHPHRGRDASVALLAEGVDRNILTYNQHVDGPMSPSSRRAWIEIGHLHRGGHHWQVALLAEGVDRNCLTPMVGVRLWSSPSSRRAWIEIPACRVHPCTDRVALLAEGVDRNSDKQSEPYTANRRPPRGGRG